MKKYAWLLGAALFALTTPVLANDPATGGDDDDHDQWDQQMVSWSTPLLIDLMNKLVIEAPVVRNHPMAPIVARDADTGQELWRHVMDFPSRFVSWTLAHGQLYALFVDVNTFENVTLAFDSATGSVLWMSRTSLTSNDPSSP